MKINKVIAVALVLLFFQSCTKEVDFNQLDDATIHATYISTLVYLNLTAPNFLDEFNQEINITSDLIEAPISSESKPYLEKLEFTVKTKNSFNRNFLLSIIFYDTFGQSIYVLQPIIDVPPNSPEITTIIEIPTEDISVIYDTQYFGFHFLLLPSDDGSVISINDSDTLTLKSAAKLFFNYRKI